ncbi:MAG TPA: radical SAM protein [bacterium]|nr:radical SAM protein [bacterium]
MSDNMKEKNAIEHLPEKFGFRSSSAAEFPEMVVIGVCFRCNARCVHCPNAKTGFTASVKGKDQLMSWDVFRKVADECSLYPHNLVRMSSAGEVLLHPEAVEMMEYLLDKKKDKNVALTTNGSLLTPGVSLRLLKSGIRSIEISVDAATPEIYEKIRVGLDFDVMLENVKALVRQRDKGGYSTRVMVSVIQQTANEDRMEEIEQFWNREVDVVLTRKLLSFGGLINRGARQDAYMPDNVPCPFLWERVLVDPVGDLRGCVNDIYNRLRIGNVMETPIRGLWRSDKLNEWRKLHVEGRRSEMPHCSECVDLEFRSWNYNYFHALSKRVDG